MDVRTQFLTISVSARIPVNGMNVNDLEAAWVEAAREGLTRSVREMQQGFQERFRDRLERREWRRRRLHTRLGSLGLDMLKVRDRDSGLKTMLGRDLLDMVPRKASPCEFAVTAIARRAPCWPRRQVRDYRPCGCGDAFRRADAGAARHGCYFTRTTFSAVKVSPASPM